MSIVLIQAIMFVYFVCVVIKINAPGVTNLTEPNKKIIQRRIYSFMASFIY